MEQFTATVDAEWQLIEAIDICEFQEDQTQDFEEVYTYGMDFLQTHSKFKYYDFEFMNYLACIFKYSTRLGPIHINEHVSMRKKIGGASVSGRVYRASIQGIYDNVQSENLAVIKTPSPLHWIANKELIHEYFVGLRLNSLRQYCVNFEYVYSMFSCYKSSYTDKPCDVDPEGNPINHLVLENIDNRGTFGEWLKSDDFSVDNFLIYFMQIVVALGIAKYSYKFAHGDLHTENILMRYTGSTEPVYVPIGMIPDAPQRYVMTRYIPTIIDYGRSAVVYNNTTYNNSYYIYEDSSQVQATSAGDIYKLLGYSLAIIWSTGKQEEADELYDLLSMPFEELLPETLIEALPILAIEQNLYFELRQNEMERQTDPNFLDEYWDAISNYYDLSRFMTVNPPNDAMVYDCSRGKCLSVEQITDKIDDFSI